LLAIGEWISNLTKHQSAAGSVALLVCMIALRLFSSGVLRAADTAWFAGLMLGGWLLTLQSIRMLREGFASSPPSCETSSAPDRADRRRSAPALRSRPAC